jgi:exosome complex component RRP41
LTEEKKKLIVDGKRLDGRGKKDLRPMKLEIGLLKKASGSCLIEWGNNKVLAAVYGPREVLPKHLENPYKAIIKCRYAMAPFSGLEEHGRAGPNRRSTEIAKVAKHVFENIVLTNQFPKTVVNVSMEILQSDGGTRVAGITAASLALADAGIPVKDVVCGVSVGKADGEIVVDLSKDEDNLGEGDMPTVVSLRTGEILLWQMDGMLSKGELAECFQLVFEACEKIKEKQLHALREKYGSVCQAPEEQGGLNDSG